MENKITEDIQRVKDIIEVCLQNYMSKNETSRYLYSQLRWDCRVTRSVWKWLEKDNPEFFKEYYTRLSLKNQIVKFNKLLDEQNKIYMFLKATCQYQCLSGGQQLAVIGNQLFHQQCNNGINIAGPQVHHQEVSESPSDPQIGYTQPFVNGTSLWKPPRGNSNISIQGNHSLLRTIPGIDNALLSHDFGSSSHPNCVHPSNGLHFQLPSEGNLVPQPTLSEIKAVEQYMLHDELQPGDHMFSHL